MQRPICENTIKRIILKRHFLRVAFNVLDAASEAIFYGVLFSHLYHVGTDLKSSESRSFGLFEPFEAQVPRAGPYLER